jgi:hypothetical protein
LTIKSTSHTTERYFLLFRFSYIRNLCFVCPSIFNCQRSRLRPAFAGSAVSRQLPASRLKTDR